MQSVDFYNPSTFLHNSNNTSSTHLNEAQDVYMKNSSEKVFESSNLDELDFSQIINDLPTPPNLSLDSATSQPTPHRVCKPHLQSMPFEILHKILQYAILDECEGNPANYYATVARFSNLLTSSLAIYNVGTPILYRHIALAHPHAFDRFLRSIEKTGFGTYTRTLDFSGFTSVGLGRSSRMNQEIQMLTSRTILRCLELCPNLCEFLASENIEQDIDAHVLEKLYSLPFLQALDFCGATHSSFVEAVASSCGFTKSENGEYSRTQDPKALEYYSRPIPSVTRLSLHGCSTLPAAVIQALIQRLPNLTRLDLTHTQINPSCLHSISISAQLTHLSISKCALLSSDETVQFFLFHPAVRHLKWLNMMYEGTRPSPLSREDVYSILKSLPPLNYLNLHGLPVQSLKPLLNMDLSSLSLGYANISLDDITKFLPQLPKLEYIDLTGNPNINIWTAQDPNLLNCNPNIKMFEFNHDLLVKLESLNIPGFKVTLSQGRRAWLFRCDNDSKAQLSNSSSGVSGNNFSVGSPHSRPTQGFTFSAYAKNKIREKEAQKEAARANSGVISPILSPETRPVTISGMDMGSPTWRNASRKMNTCFVGIGGNMTEDSVKERGIYLYYGYRK